MRFPFTSLDPYCKGIQILVQNYVLVKFETRSLLEVWTEQLAAGMLASY